MDRTRPILVAIAGLLVIAGGGRATPDTPRLPSDPAAHLARIRLIVTSSATTTDVRVDGATLASYVSTVLDGPPGTRTTQTGQTMRLSRPLALGSAEAQFDVILADVTDASAIRWTLASDTAAPKQLEVYDVSDFNRPELIDRFDSDATAAQFTTSAEHVRSRRTVRVSRVPPLVLAHFYAWYDSAAVWNDPQMLDRPAQPYSTYDPAELNRIAREAHGAGIDAFVVSYQGTMDTMDRRMRLLLDAGRGAGLEVCPMTETFDAVSSATGRVDPQVLLDWFQAIVDRYGKDPAYLTLDGRPVIFVYSASQLSTADWVTLVTTFRRSGRDALFVGDFFHSPILDPLDGEYQYINVSLTADQLRDVDLTESLRVRTFSLLRPNQTRRVWVATVSPGYDDSLLRGRPTHLVVPRAEGALYDTQWATAIQTGADWINITSWNEWWENSEIEPGVRFGSQYLDRTRMWAGEFKRMQGARERPPRRIP